MCEHELVAVDYDGGRTAGRSARPDNPVLQLANLKAVAACSNSAAGHLARC
jgi:hypothetical protein